MIAVQLPKKVLLLEVILAGLAYGCPILPLNDKYTDTEAQFYLKDAQASLFIGEYVASMEDLRSVTNHEKLFCHGSCTLPDVDEDPVRLLSIRGNNGNPKGAMISCNVMATVQGLHDSWGFSATDRLLHQLLVSCARPFCCPICRIVPIVRAFGCTNFSRDRCIESLDSMRSQ